MWWFTGLLRARFKSCFFKRCRDFFGTDLGRIELNLHRARFPIDGLAFDGFHSGQDLFQMVHAKLAGHPLDFNLGRGRLGFDFTGCVSYSFSFCCCVVFVVVPKRLIPRGGILPEKKLPYAFGISLRGFTDVIFANVNRWFASDHFDRLEPVELLCEPLLIRAAVSQDENFVRDKFLMNQPQEEYFCS
jgi:hypothetical protein